MMLRVECVHVYFHISRGRGRRGGGAWSYLLGDLTLGGTRQTLYFKLPRWRPRRRLGTWGTYLGYLTPGVPT